MTPAFPPERLVTASVTDTLVLIGSVLLPTLAKGVILRRPLMVALAERLGLDARAVKRLQRLRAKYGGGPLMLPVPVRPQAVILHPDHVRAVLAGGPEPFSPATAEKRSVLAHFEPNVSLVSRPPERQERRRLNEQVLESGCPVHSLADAFVTAASDEAGTLASMRPEVGWQDFRDAWAKTARRVVLGDAARDDNELTGMLRKLRAAANWGFLHPGRKRLLERFHQRLAEYLDRPDRTTLAGRMAGAGTSEVSAPTDQLAHYLFAFAAGGIATFRTLALLSAHPHHAARALDEVRRAGERGRKDLPFVRACIHDCLRLWPTTPAIFRETTRDIAWPGGVMPKGTQILIFAPYFHRDDENLELAHQFAPELWLEKRPDGEWPLIPFSGGPGICPARDLVPLVGSAFIAALLSAREVELTEPRFDAAGPLPGTLDHHTLRFALRPRAR